MSFSLGHTPQANDSRLATRDYSAIPNFAPRAKSGRQPAKFAQPPTRLRRFAATLFVEAPMGRRQYKRLRIALPVTVSGLDAGGNPFTQTASAIDISPHGVRLRGVRCLRQRGDPVQVEYKGKRARYRVAWIGAQGTCWEGAVGLEGVEGARFLFAEHLPDGTLLLPGAEPDTYTENAAAVETAAIVDHAAVERRDGERRKADRRQEERRRHPRYNCAGTARIWENGQEHDITGRINEISLGGCYVEMMSPMRSGTAIRLQLSVNNRSINLGGTVRNSQPTFGMGVQFTAIAPPEWEKLHRVIAELSGEVPAEPAPAPPAAPSVDQVNAIELTGALLRWFGAHDSLTRQEFLKLMQTPKRDSVDLTHATFG